MDEVNEVSEDSISRSPSEIGRFAAQRNIRSSDSLASSSDAPCCRICQCTQQENPTSKLIRPCKCSGSLLYVHIACLNTWRATSENANYHCNICGYKYIIRRTMIANILLNENTAKVLTGVFVFITGCFLGVCQKLISSSLGFDAAAIIFNLLGFVPWWRVYRLQII